MGVDNAINDFIDSATNAYRVRGQGGVLGEVQHTDAFFEPRAGVIGTALHGAEAASAMHEKLVSTKGLLAQFMLRQETADGSHGALVAIAEIRDALTRFDESDVVEVFNMGIQGFNKLKRNNQPGSQLRPVSSAGEIEHLLRGIDSFERRKDFHRQLFSHRQDMFPSHSELRDKFLQRELRGYEPGTLAGFVTVDTAPGTIKREALPHDLRHFRYGRVFLGRNHGRLNGLVDLL